MKKVLFISLALVLALSIGLVGCEGEPPGPEPSSKIVIAASVSKTGPLQAVHELAFGSIYPVFLEQNPTITVGSTNFSVEYDGRDDASVMSNMLDNTDDIIDDIKDNTVQFLFGPTCTAFLEAQATKATTGKVVQMTAEGGATSLIAQMTDYEYTFVNLSFSDWFEIPVFAKLIAEAHEAEYPGDPCNAYIGYQNDDHGLEYLGVAEDYFADEGIVIDGSYAMNSGDTTANANLIAAANATGADILCAFAYPEHVFGTAAVAEAMGYNPKAMILGPGGNFGVYGVVIAGADAEGVMCFATGNNKTDDGVMRDFFNMVQTEVGLPNTDFWGHPCYWSALQIWKEAVENVGSDNAGAGFTIDQDAYRDYLCTEKFTTVFGEVWYVTGHNLTWPVPDGSGALLNYKCHTGEIGQWQSGYVEIVGYDGIGEGGDPYGLTNYVVTAPFDYPKQAWTP